MSKVVLPYHLQDGQKAYAAKLMADFNAIVGKLNSVSVPGLADGDIESALQQIKLLLDREYAAEAKVVENLAYDENSRRLVLTLKDGAIFFVDMAAFLNDYTGVSNDGVAVSLDGERRISAELKDGGVGYAKLSQALQNLINGKITKGQSGNAEEIRFNDGESFQEKLDNEALRGPAGITAALNGICAFRVGADGHLYVGVADGAAPPPFSINGDGDLIYTIG